jgi:hypothetical protein
MRLQGVRGQLRVTAFAAHFEVHMTLVFSGSLHLIATTNQSNKIMPY